MLLFVLANSKSIVIIHGLNGHPYRTFCDPTTGFFWPSELAKSVPTARIALFGYVADVADGSSNVQGAYQHAEVLLLHLKNNRIGSDVCRLETSSVSAGFY